MKGGSTEERKGISSLKDLTKSNIRHGKEEGKRGREEKSFKRKKEKKTKRGGNVMLRRGQKRRQ